MQNIIREFISKHKRKRFRNTVRRCGFLILAFGLIVFANRSLFFHGIPVANEIVLMAETQSETEFQSETGLGLMPETQSETGLSEQTELPSEQETLQQPVALTEKETVSEAESTDTVGNNAVTSNTPETEKADSTEHVHTDACYQEVKELTCTEVEHTHDDGCYIMQFRLTCDNKDKDHVHDDKCGTAEMILMCTMKEHTHNEACFTTKKELICQK